MPKIPSITDAEWHLMKLLWDHPSRWLSAADIIDPVVTNRSINHRTVRTLLARLVKKGAVETRPTGAGNAAYLYHAKVPRDAVVRAESRSFLSRVFDGNAAPALIHFLNESRHLSPQKIEKLRAIINEKEKS